MAAITVDASADRCHHCQQPLDQHQTHCLANPQRVARQYRRRRRATRRKDFVSFPSGMYPGHTRRVRKPLHHHSSCPWCLKPSGISRTDICAGNDQCRCRGCEGLREINADIAVVAPHKARSEQRRGT